MLKPPYSKYSRIYTYHVDGTGLPELDDPHLIGSWEEDGKTIIIFHEQKIRLVEKLCKLHDCKLFYTADLDYADWEMGREVIPFSVGPMTIAPIWEAAKADIRIDPSVVFGNGFHPSTRLCLEGLVRYHEKLPKKFTGLDLGCGTGLLGVAAVRLGASSVIAVDHNSLACQVAKQNAKYNMVGNNMHVQEVDLRYEFPWPGMDLIMANLHPELLARLFAQPSFWQSRLYILSGFMLNAEEQLLAALPDPPPPLLERQALDKWRVWIMGKI